MQLPKSCDESLQRDLLRSDKTISSKSENLILSAIKRLAVKEGNTIVPRVLQHASGQRLKGQADICKYVVQCDCESELNFTEQMVRDTMIRGLEDP